VIWFDFSLLRQHDEVLALYKNYYSPDFIHYRKTGWKCEHDDKIFRSDSCTGAGTNLSFINVIDLHVTKLCLCCRQLLFEVTYAPFQNYYWLAWIRGSRHCKMFGGRFLVLVRKKVMRYLQKFERSDFYLCEGAVQHKNATQYHRDLELVFAKGDHDERYLKLDDVPHRYARWPYCDVPASFVLI
jgi:hypothetical protein